MRSGIRIVMIHRSNRRKIVNDAELTAALKSQVAGWTPVIAGKPVQVDLIDFGNISWSTQLSIASDTDILVGMQGAGMAWLYVMPPKAVMVEINCRYHSDATTGINTNAGSTFGRLASWAGITHAVYRVPEAHIVNPPKLQRAGGAVDVTVPVVAFLKLMRTALCHLTSSSPGDDRECKLYIDAAMENK